ncbi:hypothetical protein ACFXP7_12280 [Microbacterium sp. P06]|uniref:hypothetical protein n=1 Tax=unclassified Microbacterium TaxID=2609290 RepID=UPI0037472AD4
MTFEPTFQELSEAAAELPDMITEESHLPEDVDSDLSGAIEASRADEAVIEGSFARGLTTSTMAADDLPPLGA